MIEIGLIDWVLWLVYAVLIGLVLYIYKNTKKDAELYRYFMPAFLIKVIGGAIFMLIFIYYYGFGDTFLYHKGATVLSETLASDPIEYLRLLRTENGKLPADLQEYSSLIPYSRTSEEWFMVKLMSPFNFIAFNSYLVVTIFMSTISFYGSWKLFKVAVDLFPSRKTLCFLLLFLLPSTFFWGAGILKDTISMTAINIIIYASYFLWFKNQFKRKYILLFVVAGFLLMSMKLYILIAFLPGLAMGIYLNIRKRIGSSLIRYMMTPFLIGAIAFTGYFVAQQLIQANSKYAIEGLEKQARGFHTWHETTAGSAYNLGEVEYTIQGVARKIPQALNVTFFRPYVWESRNPIMFVGSIESLALFTFFIYLLLSQRFKAYRSIVKNPFIATLTVYILIFGFAIGFTSYNFGALARYKIPILSIAFLVVFYLINEKKKSQLNVDS